jgi:NAD-dependent dihydropyrimidine dehydrogenase PreA subunit
MSAKAGLVEVDNHPVYINSELCKGCGLCAKKCPADSIEGNKKEPHVINQEKCIQCGQCIKSCKFNAIQFGTEKVITLVSCECCGVPFATRQQLEYIAARTGIDCYEARLCADCRKKEMAVKISQFAG